MPGKKARDNWLMSARPAKIFASMCGYDQDQTCRDLSKFVFIPWMTLPHSIYIWAVSSYLKCKLSARSLCQMIYGPHIEILQIRKNETKNIRLLVFQFFNNRSSILMFFVMFFSVVLKIQNSNMWTAKHLAQASCTEFTLPTWLIGEFSNLVEIS